MNKKSIIEKIKMIFSEEEEVDHTFVDVKTQDGKILRVSDMVIDGTVKEITEDGEVDLEDGDYVTEEGYIITVEAGIIKDIKEPVVEEETTEEMSEELFMDLVLEDGTKVVVDTQSEGVLSTGDPVFVIDADGNRIAAPEGEHNVMGVGTIVVDAEGKLVEVKQPETEEPEETIPTEIIEAIVSVLKEEMMSTVQELKTELEVVKEENKSLKERFNKFAAEPSEEPTRTKMDFSKLDAKNLKQEKLNYFSNRK